MSKIQNPYLEFPVCLKAPTRTWIFFNVKDIKTVKKHIFFVLKMGLVESNHFETRPEVSEGDPLKESIE